MSVLDKTADKFPKIEVITEKLPEKVFTKDDYDGSEHFEIPYGFTEIGDDAFLSCSSLNKITIPRNSLYLKQRLSELGYGDEIKEI